MILGMVMRNVTQGSSQMMGAVPTRHTARPDTQSTVADRA